MTELRNPKGFAAFCVGLVIVRALWLWKSRAICVEKFALMKAVQVAGINGFVLKCVEGQRRTNMGLKLGKVIEQLLIVCGVCNLLSHANLVRNIVLNLAGLNTYATKVFGVINCVALFLYASVVVKCCMTLG